MSNENIQVKYKCINNPLNSYAMMHATYKLLSLCDLWPVAQSFVQFCRCMHIPECHNFNTQQLKKKLVRLEARTFSVVHSSVTRSDSSAELVLLFPIWFVQAISAFELCVNRFF